VSNTLLAALVGIISAVITSIISHWLLIHRLKQETAHRARTNLYENQLAAYKKFWNLLVQTSRYNLGDGIIQQVNNNCYLHAEKAKLFLDAVTSFLSSEEGIFLSRRVIDVMVRTRAVIIRVLEAHPHAELVQLSRTKQKKIQGGLRHLYFYTRDDIGLRDPNPVKGVFGHRGA
jgi:hypothetical protein